MSAIPPVEGPVGLPPVTGDPDARRGTRHHDEKGEGQAAAAAQADGEASGQPLEAVEEDPLRKGLRLDIRG